ncbi:MAG TPA: triose-phosphate isomerase [Bacteroidales bacterium]|nr:triose-phosphate isomerase [Bacteroidales bacterium]
MRKKIIAGNWKMNKTFQEADELVENISQGLKELNLNKKEVILCPPFLFAEMVSDYAEEFPFSVGVQNVSEYKRGAYTGEVSAEMIQSMDIKYVVIGHSERRSLFDESDDVLASKTDRALAYGLTPIFCCGELLEARKAENHFEVVKAQIVDGLFHLDKDEIQKVVIAYEPVWAIGTGETATKEQAQEMHQFIRKLVAAKYNKEIADEITILYGGSVKPTNAEEIFAEPDVDGGLIGGASLKAEDFLAIIDAMKE